MQKKIAIILILITLLPALFYTAYEITSLNENEKLLTQIYEQQLNSVLFSINQDSWDYIHKLINDLDSFTGKDKPEYYKYLQEYITKSAGIQAVFFSDTLVQNLRFVEPSQNTLGAARKVIVDTLRQNQFLLRRLIYRKQVGYRKIEPLLARSSDDREFLILLFALNNPNESTMVSGIVISTHRFVDEVLNPKIFDFAREEMVIGIFEKDKNTPLYATGEILRHTIRVTKKLWLFPNHYLGIRLAMGKSIETMSYSRFQRSLILILLLAVILIISAIILYRNISREMELARMKSDFVSNVSHELRTPLSLIRMFAETLEMDRVKEKSKQMEYYKIIGQESERLTHLINNILDFSKMEAGQKTYQFEIVDLTKIVEKVLGLYLFQFENHQIKLKKNLQIQPLLIRGDRDTISEAIINLIDNAIKYSTEYKQIEVATCTKNGSACIEVSDHGIGISEEEQDRIFEKFYRVSSGLIHTTRGSGLGLTLVDFIMQAHNGKIEVESKPGEGSTFRLCFQRADVDNNTKSSGD